MNLEYQQRRQAVMNVIGQGTAVFGSAPTAVMHNDVEHPFRQNSDFFYLTGFNEPDAIAILAPHHEEHQFVLFVRPKDKEKETWSGRRTGVDRAKEKYGAHIAYPIEELAEKLPQYVENADRLYYQFGNDGRLDQHMLTLWQRILAKYPKRGRGPVAIEDGRLLMQQFRRVKSDSELDQMRKAVAISAKAHNHAMAIACPGRYEYEIQAEMEHIFRLGGALGVAYPSIVASGSNACILHYVENDRQMQADELLLIDAGCAYGYYNADITRTFPVGERFTPEQRILYELVLEAQLKAIEAVQPGRPFNDFHDAATRIITEGLVDLGLLVGKVDTLIEEKKHKAFFMHGTGHFLGLDVHDSGILRNPDKTWQPFAPGNVVTVEPGIYIAPNYEPAEGQPAVEERWRGIGIRIEDDVLVTSAGHEILTAAVPKSLSAMESRRVALSMS
ncbi:aminopeptidase P N-terminal domain-containing protein [Leptolyngbya cf. ectocarpi LEGE 11479]|uniref:Xaa-Pro aminopeptidase n=1 Tax=Leptolyngbya cf. ectocarpi LEGE 11479 TaxID=1828722 RepID=A0A928X245_LEPEC|nr:aminopeptidase P N-terminal domain-containing protein [Leptolyngbya ectocarpi]MBE9066169.1 aminopeptidase P N-terminal domain-containing protein [Leptolyngbya cf. ectocarpi LEGE 11479]